MNQCKIIRFTLPTTETPYNKKHETASEGRVKMTKLTETRARKQEISGRSWFDQCDFSTAIHTWFDKCAVQQLCSDEVGWISLVGSYKL